MKRVLSDAIMQRARIFKLLRSPIDSKESISASLRSLAGRYDNPIPTRFLSPIDCLKIPAQGGVCWLPAPLHRRELPL